MGQFDYIHPAMQPQDDADAMLFAEEAFVADIQSLLHRLLEAKGVTRAELAKRLGVSRARVTQLFADDCSNVNVRTVARIFHALGEEPVLSCEWSEMQINKRYEEFRQHAIMNAGPKVTWMETWIDEFNQRSENTAMHDECGLVPVSRLCADIGMSDDDVNQLQMVA